VLTGVDGLVFVADSQRDKMEENLESFANLEENLNYYGKSLKTSPTIIQYNKRDLPTAMMVSEMDQILNETGYPTYESVATTGEGVLPTLTRITKMVIEHIEAGTSGKATKKVIPPNMYQEETKAPAPDHPHIEPEPAPIPKPIAPEPVIVLPETAPDKEFLGGRIQIVGTQNAEIIAANVINVPVRLKIQGDERIYKMDFAIKLDSIIPED
jgi:hypothetical protein